MWNNLGNNLLLSVNNPCRKDYSLHQVDLLDRSREVPLASRLRSPLWIRWTHWTRWKQIRVCRVFPPGHLPPSFEVWYQEYVRQIKRDHNMKVGRSTFWTCSSSQFGDLALPWTWRQSNYQSCCISGAPTSTRWEYPLIWNSSWRARLRYLLLEWWWNSRSHICCP